MQKELDGLLAALPHSISRVIKSSDAYKSGRGINEIRIRLNRPLSITYRGKNLSYSHVVEKEEMTECVMSLCKRSLYSYMDTIREGYIPFSDCVRVGVCGRAVCEGNRVVNISDITSLNIRVPSSVCGVADELYKALRDGGFSESAIVFSPPGAGKTTLLRDIALSLSERNPCKRVALIDSRCELGSDAVSQAKNIDLYAGYPKAKGIELATRTMSPEYIICDEIGYEEAESILATRSGGVPLIVGAHASTLEKLLSGGLSERLHKAGIFDLYVNIRVLESGKRELDIVRYADILRR